MRKGIAVIAVAGLAALALFLPEWVSGLQDKQLLDSPSIQVQNGEQEGFAESLQLSVGEKVMLLRSGSMTVMDLDHDRTEVAYVLLSGDAEAEFSIGRVTISEVPNAAVGDDIFYTEYTEELSQLWQTRLEEIQNELRSLQAAGGLPELWSEDSELRCSGRGDLLYIDPDTKMNFQVYRALLESDSYTMDLTVDVQSGRILCFNLRWGTGAAPSWGIRGAYDFGGAWRNYWGLDSVNIGWYNAYNKNILDQIEDSYRINGDYSIHEQIAFTYDGQTFPIPLDCEAYSGRSFSISWNNF